MAVDDEDGAYLLARLLQPAQLVPDLLRARKRVQVGAAQPLVGRLQHQPDGLEHLEGVLLHDGREALRPVLRAVHDLMIAVPGEQPQDGDGREHRRDEHCPDRLQQHPLKSDEAAGPNSRPSSR